VAHSVLNTGEVVKYGSFVKTMTMDNGNLGSGTLFFTGNRVVFVMEQGTFNKKYNIHHWYYFASVTNVRLEQRMFGRALVLDVNFGNSRHTYRYEGIEHPEIWFQDLSKKVNESQTRAQVQKKIFGILNSKERTKISEIQSIYRAELPDHDLSNESMIAFLRDAIAVKQVEGFVDEERMEFVHMTAYKQKTEVVQYNVAVSFSLGSDGALEIKCPHCGASQQLAEKERKVTCKYCSREYFVPDKILNML